MTRTAPPHPLSSIVSPVDDMVGINHAQLPNGALEARLQPLSRCLDGTGELAIGVLFMLADIVLARVSLHEVADDQHIATSNLHLDILSRPTMDSGLISGRGHADAVIDGAVRCRADLVGPGGRLMAVAAGRFVALDLGSAAAAQVHTPHVVATSGEPVTSAVPGAGPVHELLGFRLIDVSGPMVRFAITAGADFSNDRGGIHGGIGALIGEQAASLALGLVKPSTAGMRPFDMRAVFVRPIEASAAMVTCDAEVLHAGRTLAATRATLRTRDGRLAVVVDVLHARTDTDRTFDLLSSSKIQQHSWERP